MFMQNRKRLRSKVILHLSDTPFEGVPWNHLARLEQVRGRLRPGKTHQVVGREFQAKAVWHIATDPVNEGAFPFAGGDSNRFQTSEPDAALRAERRHSQQTQVNGFLKS